MRKKARPIERLPLPPELEETAIGRCCEAWSRAYENAVAEGRGEVSCAVRANEAYRIAMPPLTSPENIRTFVACVTHGLLMGTIIDMAAARLFQAAQVASRVSTSPSRRSQPSDQSPSSAPKTASTEQLSAAKCGMKSPATHPLPQL